MEKRGHCLHSLRQFPPPTPLALPLLDSSHLLVDIHDIMLGLQLHLAQPGDLLPRRLVGLPAGLLGSQRRLQVGDVYLVDAAVAAHLGGGRVRTRQGLCPTASRRPHPARLTWPPPHRARTAKLPSFHGACPEPAHLQGCRGDTSSLPPVSACLFPPASPVFISWAIYFE